ncbi:hypothetical protein B0T14DRAFT_314127 [Immersiella caudata]|uniref:FAD-binding domain-containing protein n=1 Tax=Immersiella caudata TaxID=314043 RepID=A0AA39T1A1_9PEZI|nr:hypothetical protein B0T14DRAFT_314127 [Immersiella caudata]
MKAAMSRESFCEPFYSAVHCMAEESSPVFMRQLQYWPTVSWDNRGGGVTLVGDAAHCMLPSTLRTYGLEGMLLAKAKDRGQGLSQALTDVDGIFAQILRVKEEGTNLGEALATTRRRSSSEAGTPRWILLKMPMPSWRRTLVLLGKRREVWQSELFRVLLFVLQSRR